MPDPVTWGHVPMLAGLLVGLYGLVQLAAFLRHRGTLRATPQYARPRDGRRYALWSLAAAIILFAAGCFTRLGEVPLT